MGIAFAMSMVANSVRSRAGPLLLHQLTRSNLLTHRAVNRVVGFGVVGVFGVSAFSISSCESAPANLAPQQQDHPRKTVAQPVDSTRTEGREVEIQGRLYRLASYRDRCMAFFYDCLLVSMRFTGAILAKTVLVAVMPTKGCELAMSRLCWLAICVYPVGVSFSDTTLNGQSAGQATYNVQYKRLDGEDVDGWTCGLMWCGGVCSILPTPYCLALAAPLITQNGQFPHQLASGVVTVDV